MTEKLDAIIEGTVLPGTFVNKSAEILGPDVRQLLLDKAATTETKKLMPQIARDLRRDFLAHSKFRHSHAASQKSTHRGTYKDGSPLPPRQKQAFDLINLGVDGYDGIGSLLRGVEMKEAAQPKLSDAMDKHFQFKGFDSANAWRLFMDASDQEPMGDYRYENESGYMAGLMTGYTEMLNTWLEPLNADLLARMHDTCVDAVLERGQCERTGNLSRILGVIDPKHDPFMAKGFRNGSDNGFRLILEINCSERGMAEIAAVGKKYGDFKIRGEDGKQELWTEPRGTKECAAIATRIIETYRGDLKHAATKEQKAMAIARCCRDLEVNHLFADGNARTVGFVLVNKLLLQNGLPPAAMADPNIFDGFTIAEVAAKIAEGQQRFAGYRNQG